MSYKEIGKLIHFHRKKARLTQHQLADLAGLGKTVVFDVEKGKLSIRYDTLLKLLAVLNITIEFRGLFTSLEKVFDPSYGFNQISKFKNPQAYFRGMYQK